MFINIALLNCFVQYEQKGNALNEDKGEERGESIRNQPQVNQPIIEPEKVIEIMKDRPVLKIPISLIPAIYLPRIAGKRRLFGPDYLLTPLSVSGEYF